MFLERVRVWQALGQAGMVSHWPLPPSPLQEEPGWTQGCPLLTWLLEEPPPVTWWLLGCLQQPRVLDPLAWSLQDLNLTPPGALAIGAGSPGQGSFETF